MADPEMKALVVDDSLSMRNVLVEMLRRFGIEKIDTAKDGLDGLQQIKKNGNAYSIVFVDLQMPKVDGPELLRMMNDTGFKNSVVIVSAMEQRIIDLASNLGKMFQPKFLGSLTKPFQYSQLENILKKNNDIEPVWVGKKIDEYTLRQALADNMLVPYFQPQVDKESGRLTGFEALARIILPGQTEAVNPGAFISVAKESGLIQDVDFTIMRKSMEGFAKNTRSHTWQLSRFVS